LTYQNNHNGINLYQSCIYSEGKTLMKNKSFIFPTMVFLWILFIFASPVQQKTKWKGTVEEIDGVTVVKNPKQPMYGSDVFHLEEELAIGEEGKGDEYIFSEARDIAVDEEGKIFVLDSDEAHIKVLNNILNLLKQSCTG